ncbi:MULTISPECIES: MFS transporter [unclassified Paenibacillus]|uniref:MDR family MFS transporter n=1 Tax=unclassified Paenibacillus TaxID=185978 RepID=UPI0008C51383|nr:MULTISPECIES: MFS transporter [unclassified Paenibacillus]QLG40376.1 MFS transporter [Paenibacillus sp. E222]SEN72726.1 Predicted arabinose efflux permease, MFS family [Paenibacillus sp. OK076]
MKIKSWDLNLKIRLSAETIFNLLYWMYFPFITIYFSQSLGNHIAGLLMTVPPLISIFGNILGGYLADKMGRRFVMLLGASIQAIMFVGFAVTGNDWISYISFIGIGLGGAVYGPASDAMVADLTPPQERRQVFATFITAKNIGAVLGPALGAFFFFNYRSELLWTCAIVMLLYALAIYLKVYESMPNHELKRLEKTTFKAAFKEEWSGYGTIFRDKPFLLYLFGGVLGVIITMQLDLYLAIYVNDYVPAQDLFNWNNFNLSLNSSEILGWMLGLNGLLFVFFVLPVTKWLSKWSDKNVFILSAVLAGVGTFLLGFTTNIWILFLLTIVFTFGEIVRAPVIDNFIADYAPENARGKYMGASRLQFTIGRFLAPVTVFMSEWISPIGIFSTILILAALSALVYIRLYKVYDNSKIEKVEASSSDLTQ